MNIYTSYFSNLKNLTEFDNFFTIAGKSPDFYMHLWAKEPNKYHQCKKLAPKYTWWKEWHDGELSNEQYTEKYYETVLNQLEPQKIFDELTWNNTKDAILLCWESREKFCHRHIVADWLSKELGIEVNEL